jgi:hypothetical protein
MTLYPVSAYCTTIPSDYVGWGISLVFYCTTEIVAARRGHRHHHREGQ